MSSFQETREAAEKPQQDIPLEAEKLIGKVSHDQLCETLHKQTQYYDKDLEKDLLAVSVSEAKHQLQGK